MARGLGIECVVFQSSDDNPLFYSTFYLYICRRTGVTCYYSLAQTEDGGARLEHIVCLTRQYKTRQGQADLSNTEHQQVSD